MWLFTSGGFVSIVQDRDDKDNLIVRARVKNHLLALFPKAKVTETLEADYRFRSTLRRKAVEKVVAKQVASITYDNFKRSIGDRGYHDACLNVWDTMRGLQNKLNYSHSP
jgi:hypothetical protein